MSNLNEFLTFDCESAYDFAYDLTVKKNYSTPKIYTAKGDLKKRWYVYFSYRNPKTGRLKRITPFYGEANKYKFKEDRLFVLSAYRKKILELLKAGFNPFDENQELYKKRKDKKIETSNNLPLENKPTQIEIKPETNQKTINEAFEFALQIKKNVVGNRTYKEYVSKVNKLQLFIKNKYPNILYVDQITKNILVQFLNDVLQRTSARSRNNYRLDLSSLYQVLEDNEIISANLIKKIPVLKAIPERNKTYSNEVQEAIFSYLEKEDPVLLLYIKFISYNFLRPIEVNRLNVGDLNLKDKTIQFKAKNSPLKTKIIPNILIEELPDLTQLEKSNPLFAPNGYGEKWEATFENRRSYFGKRFKKVVKDHFNLGKDYGLYSFRHTYITKLYRELAKNATPFETKSRLMLITGHSSMEALEKYLRDIDAALPMDYSELIRTK